MERRVRFLALSLCLAFPACKKTITTLAVVEKPVNAAIVVTDDTDVVVPAGGGRGSLGAPEIRRDQGTALSVVGAKKIGRVELSKEKWSRADLVADPEGRRVAYREKGPWAWAHVTANGDAWPGVGRLDAREIDWSRVPSLADEAPKIFPFVDKLRQRDFFAELVRQGGDPAAVAFLVASADVAVDTGTGEGSWLSLARNLPPGRKAEVDRGLRPRLLDPKTPLDKLERVVDVVDAGDPALAEPVSARLRALALTTPDASERVAAVLLRGLTRGNKRLAADVGCEILGRAVGKDGRVAPRGTPQHVESARQHLVEAALVAVAHARAKCAHAEPLYTVEPCDASMRCGAAAGNETPPDAGGKDPSELPLCARDELLKEIDAAAAARDDRDDYPLVLWVSKGFPRLALGVALGSGAAIDDVKRANARRSYGVSGHSRACPAADLREDACKLHSSRSDEGRCPFVVDDRARRITVKPAADR